MLFTERKALEEMFSYLEEDKRTIKAQARQDIENIESRQMQLLDRLQRLDEIEREAVDVEGVLTQLAATTQELTQLIPNVPFGDVLERAAQLIAEKPENAERINPEPAKSIMREKIVEAARVQQVNSMPIKKAASATPRGNKNKQVQGLSKDKGTRALITLLEGEGRALKGATLKKLFEKETNIIYANFHSKLKEWTAYSGGRIIKDGPYYHLKEHELHEQQRNDEPARAEAEEKTTV